MNFDSKTDKWDAKHYKKHSEGQFNKGVSTIHGIKFNGKERVLDVGCGDGRITTEIAKHVPHGHVVGVDVSQNMIDEAKKSFGHIKNLEFKCVSAVNFSSDIKFDLAVSFSAFHWIKDQPGTLKNIYNHLKPEGKLIIKTGAFCLGPVTEVYRLEKWVPLLSEKEQTYFPHTVESMGKLLEDTGFQNIDIKQEIATRTFQNKEDLFNSVFAWVPHATGLPEGKAREFTQDIVDHVCAARNDGKIIFETALLDARAEKPEFKS